MPNPLRALLLLALAASLACIAPPPSFDAGSDDEARDGGEGSDAGPEDGGPPLEDACPDDACAEGCEAPVGGLCVDGQGAASGRIEADAPFSISLLTTMCLGSSCTEVLEPLCDVQVDGARVRVGGVSCWRALPVDGCSEDCGGADGALCTVPGLPAGDYVFEVDGREPPFRIPMELGSDASCLFPE